MVSGHADFERGAVHEGQVDDPRPALQPGDGGGGAADPVSEDGECPRAVLASESDERAGAPLRPLTVDLPLWAGAAECGPCHPGNDSH